MSFELLSKVAVNQFGKLKRRRKVNCIYPFCYSFSSTFLNSNITCVIYFLLRKKFLTHSFRLGLLATNSFNFPSPMNVLISFLLIKDIFSGYRIMCLQFFPFISWLKFCHFLLACMVSDEKSGHSNCLSSSGDMSFFSGCFQDCFLCL